MIRVNEQEVAVFFMTDEKRGIYFHSEQEMICEEFNKHKHKEIYIENKVKEVVRILEEKQLHYLKEIIYNTVEAILNWITASQYLHIQLLLTIQHKCYSIRLFNQQCVSQLFALVIVEYC